jgi:hypothetical protein
MSIVSCSERSSDRKSEKSSKSEDKKTSKSEESKVSDSDGSYSLADLLDDEWIMTCYKGEDFFIEESRIFKEDSSGKYTYSLSAAFYKDEECEDSVGGLEFNDIEAELDIDGNIIEACLTEEGNESFKKQFKKQMREEPEEESGCLKISFTDIDEIEFEDDEGEIQVYKRK